MTASRNTIAGQRPPSPVALSNAPTGYVQISSSMKATDWGAALPANRSTASARIQERDSARLCRPDAGLRFDSTQRAHPVLHP